MSFFVGLGEEKGKRKMKKVKRKKTKENRAGEFRLLFFYSRFFFAIAVGAILISIFAFFFASRATDINSYSLADRRVIKVFSR